MIKGLIFIFTVFIACLSWRPVFVPPKNFWVAGEGSFPVHIFFYDAPCWACSHHVSTVLQFESVSVVVDASSAGLVVYPLSASIEDFILRTRPCYGVTYFADVDVSDVLYTGGLFSCVEITKKLISCNNSVIQLPNQLLHWLWEVRHE